MFKSRFCSLSMTGLEQNYKSILCDNQEHFDRGFASGKAYIYKCKFHFI